ncbi:MAG: DNA methyltransferase [Anaerolineaceae bacterium]|nr:DNA methyltransferase [Anaerolineaceae bacterium]
MNRLYYGDCLTIMQGMPQQSVDLIYLDPPFNSNRSYNAIYKDETGRPLPDQIEAFCDQWELDAERERVIRHMPVLMRETGIDDQVAEFWRVWVNALRHTQPRLLAYLSYMVERLIWMRLLLKPSGALFLHCDQTVAHYMKVMLDGVLGHSSFRNEIIWRRTTAPKTSQFAQRTLSVDTDTIFYYARSDAHRMNRILREYTDDEVERYFPHSDSQGRYRTDIPLFCSPSLGPRPNLCYEYNGVRNPHPSGWRVSREKLAAMDARGEIIWRGQETPLRKSYLSQFEGRPLNNLWSDIPNARGKERLGYATQKPLALLERIVRAASPHDGMVLDPFCGCATTLEAAHRLGRRWIGIDIAIHAVRRVAQVRLEERLELVEGRDFEVEGVPRNMEGAIDLWKRDRYHFQKWAVEQVDGFVTSKRTADGGIDGRIYFAMPDEEQLQSMVVEVKGGRNVNIGDVRALGNVLDSSGAQLAGLIVMHPPGERQRRNFEREMAAKGDLEIDTVPETEYYQRMQLLTVQEILEGKRFDTPGARGRRASPQHGLNMPDKP